MSQLWIAGHNVMEFSQGGTEYIAWDVLGIFSSEEKAIAACHDENCFVDPFYLDEFIPPDVGESPGCYYPFAEEE